MSILFIHQNFPGQFKHLAPALVAQGHAVHATILLNKSEESDAPFVWQGVRMWPYRINRGSTPNIHPWVNDLEAKVIRGEAFLRHALQLKKQGIDPQLVVCHPGWGEGLFVKQVWPAAKLLMYCEWYYSHVNQDYGFDPEFEPNEISAYARLRFKNINNDLHMELADGALSPTHWQKSTYPAVFQPSIRVVHDGIDTTLCAPNPSAALAFKLENGETARVDKNDEVLTFVNRNLEPSRGYHVFMRALPAILKARPNLKVLIVGGSGVSYGAAAPQGSTWKQIFIDEIRPKLSSAEWSRIYFLGNLEYKLFVPLLQLSTVHVYLTYPFVLGWSLLEAMSIGCAIVASNTPPVVEAIEHGQQGVLVNFFDHQAIANAVIELLENPEQRATLGSNARKRAVENYDLQTVCLPKQLKWLNSFNTKEST